MAKNKTIENDSSVDAYIEAIADSTRRADCRRLIKLMNQATKAKPKMWGTSIVGFGKCHYRYASGHEGDMCLTGFSSRKAAISIYLACGGACSLAGLLAKLGKHKMGKGCLSLKCLDDVDEAVLAKLIKLSVAETKRYVDQRKKENTRA